MPGAGSATLLFGKEASFTGSVTDDDGDGNPDYYHFGRNPSVEELAIENQLQRMVEAGVIQSVESVKSNFEGAFSVTAVVNNATHDQVEKLVFNDGGTSFTTGRAQSAEVIVGSQYLTSTGTSEKLRALKGVIPTDYELSYSQGGMVELSLTMLYATEADATQPADVTAPAGGGDAAFHNFRLDIDGTSVSDLQDCTLSFSNLYGFQRGTSTEPLDAVLRRPEVTLDATAIWSGPDRMLDNAYGSAGATTPADRLNAVPGTVDVTIGGTTVTTLDLPSLKPDSYSWESLISGDEDTRESATFHVNGGVTVTA